ALPFVDEPRALDRESGLGRRLVNVGADLWSVARSRLGFLALVLCFLPLGAGAASGLWSTVAPDWRASANVVVLVTGLGGGVISMAGCLLGGWICDRMNRQAAYALFGVLQAACAVAMAMAPRTEGSYVLYTSLYAVT